MAPVIRSATRTRGFLAATLALSAAVVLGSCGSRPTPHTASSPAAGTSPGPAATTTPGTTPAPAAASQSPASAPAHPSRTLHLALAATSSPAGSARATIRTFHGSAEICWNFSHVAGLEAPSAVEIRLAGATTNGVPFLDLGRYRTKGCLAGAANEASSVDQIDRTPADFLLVVDAGTGASTKARLRGQLAPAVAPSLPSAPPNVKVAPEAPTASPTSISVTLKPPAAGQTAASAALTLRVVGSADQLCWSFSKLVGIADPVRAHLQIGQGGDSDSSANTSFDVALGPHFTTRGCTKVIASTLGFIQAQGGEFFVSIDTSSQPDAVSAEL